jgi:EthD domain
MLKVMAFLVKRPDISREKLIDYYENNHVPLILSLGPPPARYTRNYIQRDVTAEPRDDFDIITELEFADVGTYRAWVGAMYAPGSGVAEDEAKFLDRSKTRSYTVIERTT